MTSIAQALAAVLKAEVDRRVAAVQALADNAVNDMQQAINRLSAPYNAAQPASASAARSGAHATAQAALAVTPRAGQQLSPDDPRLFNTGFEVAQTPVGLVRSGFVQFGGSLPLVRES
jgi:hypothetical protein